MRAGAELTLPTKSTRPARLSGPRDAVRLSCCLPCAYAGWSAWPTWPNAGSGERLPSEPGGGALAPGAVPASDCDWAVKRRLVASACSSAEISLADGPSADDDDAGVADRALGVSDRTICCWLWLRSAAESDGDANAGDEADKGPRPAALSMPAVAAGDACCRPGLAPLELWGDRPPPPPPTPRPPPLYGLVLRNPPLASRPSIWPMCEWLRNMLATTCPPCGGGWWWKPAGDEPCRGRPCCIGAACCSYSGGSRSGRTSRIRVCQL